VRGKRRVDGGLASGGSPSAKARGPHAANGGRLFGARRSSSRERPRDRRELRGPFGTPVPAAATETSWRWKTSRPTKRTPFTRPPRNRSWRPSSELSEREQRSRWVSEEEATGMSAALSHGSATRKNHAARMKRTSRGRSEDRVVKTRPSPVSPASSGPSPSVPGPLASGRAERHAKRHRVGAHVTRVTEREPAVVGAEGRPRAVVAPGDDEHECSVRCFGVQKSVERIAFRVSTGVNDITHGRAE
jgi:hypothetical protein